jgi:hypothetical protein
VTAQLTATIEGQVFPVDVLAVTALDALVYERATGGMLEAKIAELTEAASTEGAMLRSTDIAVVKWLWVRQHVDRDAGFAAVVASVPLFPVDPAPEAGDPVAPGAG